MNTPRLLLGSTSPRRREILNFFNIPYNQCSPNYDEASVPYEGDPVEYVKTLTRGKAQSLESKLPILTADTIVECEGIVYGKPKNHQDAVNTLAALSGHWHTVYTALCLKTADNLSCEVERTQVLFHTLTPHQINKYLQQLHCDDKAGAYLIQGAGSIIVSKIEGCYYNIVGMPISALQRLLLPTGIDLWDHLA